MLNEINTTAQLMDDHNSLTNGPGNDRDLALGLEEVEPWPDPIAGPELLAALRDVIESHVVLPPFAANTLALWTLHTYAFELRDVSTYVGLGSPQKRCGKS